MTSDQGSCRVQNTGRWLGITGGIPAMCLSSFPFYPLLATATARTVLNSSWLPSRVLRHFLCKFSVLDVLTFSTNLSSTASNQYYSSSLILSNLSVFFCFWDTWNLECNWFGLIAMSDLDFNFWVGFGQSKETYFFSLEVSKALSQTWYYFNNLIQIINEVIK